jgi:zinc protease
MACCVCVVTQAVASEKIQVPFEKFVLANGLTVLVHEDDKAPIVAVGVWYHVGSKDETEGRTGFAHLFEHLMFEGSENHDGPFSGPLEQVGATSMNGTTWLDRTNYFETVPTPALELALWLESDRMGHLLGAVTQQKLDQERAVVQNEKREGDNRPYAAVDDRILEGLFPPGHPYRHSTIGSLADLDAASLEDVHGWFTDYYGAANTVLVLAGDIEPERGRSLAEKYFGHIAAGPPVTRLTAWVPDHDSDVREVMHDRVTQARIYRTWAVPGWTSQDRLLLQLAASILGDGKNARLYQALIQELQYAVSVSAEVQPFELASLFAIDTTLAPGVSIQQVDDIIDQELQSFLLDGPGEDELQRAKTRINAAIIRGLERVGGFQGKATTLAQGELYDGHPDFYRTALSWINQATTLEVRDAARRWLGRGAYELDVLPFGDYRTGQTAVDRSAGPPPVGALPDLQFPDVERARLDNGIEVVFARRTAIPVVNLALQFDAGFSADAGSISGTAAFTLAMMEESTRNRSATEIEKAAEALGAEITTDSDLDSSRIVMSALSVNLQPSLELFADVARNPAFASDEMEQLKTRWLAGIEEEKNDPLSLALRTLPPLVYGDQHAYGIPFTGSGTPESIEQLQAGDLAAFHRRWIRPDNGTLFVVGDTTLDEVLPLLEAYLGNWKRPRKDLPDKDLPEVPQPAQSRLIVIDRPGAPQSLIMAAQLAPPTGVEDNVAILMTNDVLGGTYSARINQELRTRRQWSYGAFTFLFDARGQRPWMVYAPVESQHTADAVGVLLEQFRQITGPGPVTEVERNRVYRSSAFSLPGRFETSTAVLDALLANDRYGRPDDYVSTLRARYESVTREEMQETASRLLHPNTLTWVIVGNRAGIEEGLRSLEIAELEFMDADGRPVP